MLNVEITELRQDRLAELRFPLPFWMLELLFYLKLITRHQKPSNFEDKCFCATISATACAHKAHIVSMLVSKQMS